MITVSLSAAVACELAAATHVATSTFTQSRKLVYTIFCRELHRGLAHGMILSLSASMPESSCRIWRGKQLGMAQI